MENLVRFSMAYQACWPPGADFKIAAQRQIWISATGRGWNIFSTPSLLSFSFFLSLSFPLFYPLHIFSFFSSLPFR